MPYQSGAIPAYMSCITAHSDNHLCQSRFGCPDIEEIESFNNIYAERLDEIIEKREIPIDLALEVGILYINPNNAIISPPVVKPCWFSVILIKS